MIEKWRLKAVYKVVQTPTLSINKMDLCTCDSATCTRARGVWRIAHLEVRCTGYIGGLLSFNLFKLK